MRRVEGHRTSGPDFVKSRGYLVLCSPTGNPVVAELPRHGDSRPAKQVLAFTGAGSLFRYCSEEGVPPGSHSVLSFSSIDAIKDQLPDCYEVAVDLHRDQEGVLRWDTVLEEQRGDLQ